MAATAFSSILKARNIRLDNRRPTLRIVETHVTLQEKSRRQAEKDLGINIEFYPDGSAEVLLKASTNWRHKKVMERLEAEDYSDY